MIYFDSAATTLQKPSTVGRASLYALHHLSTPGRGAHKPAAAAARVAFDCREEASALFHVPPERVVFTFNATHGLNIAIKSLVHPGDTVLISGYEHNAVARPLSTIPNIDIKLATSAPFEPESLLCSFKEKLSESVSVVICNHVSNVFGYILPVGQIADLCRKRGIPFILDASQSAGTLPVDCEALGTAFTAMPGHKGLYGPQGTGLLLCGENAPAHTLMEGGTGSLSASMEMPDFLPDRLEAGTHNITGIAGLLEGMRFIHGKTIGDILKHEKTLVSRAVSGLSSMAGVRVFAAEHLFCQSGVLSFQVNGMDCEEVGRRLAQNGIAVRAGLHCAPLAHYSAGTLEEGTVRISFSAFNTLREVDYFLRAMQEIVKNK